ncbi:MAG: outer membrane lipoprotein carrier protein LolA [Bacteroidales bacterium]|nr:outer membrane lipoprotein carrier protein LolA [Bacteroidales bacterium]
MHRLIILMVLNLVTCALNVSAQDGYVPVVDAGDFKSRLESVSEAVQTIESDFIQEKKLSVLADKIISKGSFSFRKQNNIRWEYTEPYRYLIILSGGRVFISEESGQNQYDLESNRMFREMNRFISGCIQGDILKDDAGYHIEYLENEKEYFVKLVPSSRVLREMLNEVQIAFDKADLTVTRITMVEPGGDYTKISFVNKKLNTDIPVEKFSFN